MNGQWTARKESSGSVSDESVVLRLWDGGWRVVSVVGGSVII